MSGFKLIAIRPLIGCDNKYSKNLELGELYTFYDDYKFYTTDGKKVKGNLETSKIEFTNSVPAKLYNIRSADGKKHFVNISAIVGKNGSGKSALAELFFVAIYILSVNRKILEPNLKNIPKAIEKYERSLYAFRKNNYSSSTKSKDVEEIIEDLKTLLEFEFDINDFKSYIQKQFKKESKYRNKINYYEQNISNLKNKQKEIESIQSKLFVEIYYQISNTIFKVKIAGKDKANQNPICIISIVSSDLIETNKKILKMVRNLKLDLILDETFDLVKYFFYTISINYSQYSLNSNFLGDWIRSLFHKNDGYKTPIVINPMRVEGNYDINKEMKFAKYRLLSNILIERNESKANNSHVFVSDNLYISYIRFSLNTKKIEEQVKQHQEESDVVRDKNLVKDLLTNFFEISNISDVSKMNSGYFDIISNYIIDKVDKISETYVGYEDPYHPTDTISNDRLINKLLNDGSHIGFKLYQALNFLYHGMYRSSTEKIFEIDKDFIDFSLSELLEWMEKPDSKDIIKHLPPPIFDFEIFLSDGKDDNISFNTLSSGEQQLIHSIQSVIYHINNLQSVHLSSIKRTSYKNVCILYDEIELYFHPEYQQKFVKELLRALERLYIDKIEAINILFSSHSPFILSDIPSSNILKLKKGKIEPNKLNDQTFGANINDILANDFFLTNGFMGEFVKDKINYVIDFISENSTIDDEKAESIKEIIELIGEPLIRSELRELFLKKFYENEDIEVKQIDIEILRLQQIKEKKINNNDPDKQ